MPRQRGKLATLHKAVLKGEEVLCKVIYSDRINNFLVEDFLETVVKLSFSPVKANLMPVLGYFFDEQAFYLFTPQKISLYTLLHEFETSRRPIDLHKFFIIEILFALHSVDPSIIHGHISSHNIFVEPDFQHNYKVYLGDMELSPFIKFGTLFCDYQPWSVWSSPEILSQAPKILEPTKQMDSYSFGMLLWEIFHNQVPFGNDLALTRDYVLKQHARPQISENVGAELAKLIRLCWLTNPDQRFQFSSIYSKLRQE
ncbi:hypothetical protein FGO68_gene9249 [Halteria grandinella]|uniref:Protein kinase domain-containing protein n=1 Tax=Halteria grandinella TaxID=5974 RepID=A0A8J8T4Y3_HALGN|nr:hypothetical protein FGO68_gene9249 [Halteria grandinella]